MHPRKNRANERQRIKTERIIFKFTGNHTIDNNKRVMSMIGKMKAKMILVSIMIAMIAGMVSGGTLWLCENCKCLCKKAKKMME